MAYRCGDDTARLLGRITLNPLPHLDPFGSVLLPLLLIITKSTFLIAWAKPVPVNPRNFRNPTRDDILVSVSGCAVNVLLAFAFTLCAIFTLVLLHRIPGLGPYGNVFLQMCLFGIWINLILAIFNLIPIPPLDGSHILRELLPYSAAVEYDRIGRYGFILLLLLVMTPLFSYVFFPARVMFGLLKSLILLFA